MLQDCEYCKGSGTEIQTEKIIINEKGQREIHLIDGICSYCKGSGMSHEEEPVNECPECGQYMYLNYSSKGSLIECCGCDNFYQAF